MVHVIATLLPCATCTVHLRAVLSTPTLWREHGAARLKADMQAHGTAPSLVYAKALTQMPDRTHNMQHNMKGFSKNG